MSRANKLSKKSQSLVDEFEADAKHWGWEEDQGCGSDVDNARQNHEASKLALERHIARLEARLKQHKLRSDLHDQ